MTAERSVDIDVVEAVIWPSAHRQRRGVTEEADQQRRADFG